MNESYYCFDYILWLYLMSPTHQKRQIQKILVEILEKSFLMMRKLKLERKNEAKLEKIRQALEILEVEPKRNVKAAAVAIGLKRPC